MQDVFGIRYFDADIAPLYKSQAPGPIISTC